MHPGPARSGTLFTVEDLGKRYGSAAALERISLALAPGSVTALIGSSGSGKSTLLRLLIGLDWPDEGRVLVEGQPLRPQDCLALRRRIGTVTQDGGLFPHLTVRGNLALLPRHLGCNAARIEARAAELAQLVRLPRELLARYPGELSGGQRQRVAMMRALMTNPDALLLDEPLGALDPVVRHELQEELRQVFAGYGNTVILVTHDLPEAAYLAPRLVLLHQGRIVQDGTPRELIEQPANEFARRFVAAHRELPRT